MSDDDAVDTVRALVRQMEAMLLGLQQLRGYVGNGVGKEMLEVLIQEAEVGMEESKVFAVARKKEVVSARTASRSGPLRVECVP